MNNDPRIKKVLSTLREFSRGNYNSNHLGNGGKDDLDLVLEELAAYGKKMSSATFTPDVEARINTILNIILKYTLLDFSEKAPITEAGDEIDAIAVGLNTLAEELESKIIEEKKHTEDLERLAIILETTADAVTTLDLNGKITTWNRGAERIYGYASEELIGKVTFAEITAEEDKKELSDAIEKVKLGKELLDFQIRRKHKNGGVIDVSITLTPIYDKNNKIVSISAISRDITAQKKAEELLRRSEETFRLLVKSVKDYAIFKIDTAGFISSWNSGAEHITGYKESEIIGKHISIFYTPEQIDRKEPETDIALAIKNGDHFSLDLKVKKDGSTFLCEAVCTPSYNQKGELTGLSKVLKDVTEAKRAEEMIREAKEQIESIISSAPSAVIVMNESGKIINWNSKAETMFGWKAEEVLNKQMHDFIMPPRYYEAHKKGLANFIKTGYGPIMNRIVEITALRKSREEFPVELAISAFKSKDKYIFISFINDITERKKTQSALQTANEELNKANKELESFSYSVSHDLRAPLRAIHGYTSIMMQELEGKINEDEKVMMNSILKNTQKMGQLIDDLLAFSRLGKKALVRRPVDLKEIVESVLKSFEDAPTYKKARIIMGDLGTAWADSNLIAQVYQNLLSNAFKYSAMKDQPVIEIGAKMDNGTKVYFIKDNGAGFNMAYYDKLFGVFQRLHDAGEFEGTGVGLAIVKRIIDRHNGKVWAHSKQGEGATFYFTLEPQPVLTEPLPL